MKELYIFCEGQTEQGFCTRVLQPYLFPQHDGLVHPIRIAQKRKSGKIYRGGVNKYQIIRDDMLRAFSAQQRPQVVSIGEFTCQRSRGHVENFRCSRRAAGNRPSSSCPENSLNSLVGRIRIRRLRTLAERGRPRRSSGRAGSHLR